MEQIIGKEEMLRNLHDALEKLCSQLFDLRLETGTTYDTSGSCRVRNLADVFAKIDALIETYQIVNDKMSRESAEAILSLSIRYNKNLIASRIIQYQGHIYFLQQVIERLEICKGVLESTEYIKNNI